MREGNGKSAKFSVMPFVLFVVMCAATWGKFINLQEGLQEDGSYHQRPHQSNTARP